MAIMYTFPLLRNKNMGTNPKPLFKSTGNQRAVLVGSAKYTIYAFFHKLGKHVFANVWKTHDINFKI